MTLELAGVHKRLGGRRVLAGVDLRCGPGETAVVMGGNGAGKSTLLRVAAGLLEPDRGEVRLRGHVLSGGGVAARRELGYVPDATDALPDLLVCEFAALVRALKRAPPPPEALIDGLGVRPFFRRRLRALSFGQRKRALLLAALIGDPWLLLLDEPTNGLDPEGVALTERLVRERAAAGKASAIATNDPPFAAAIAGSVYRLDDGALAPAPALGAP